MTPTQSRLMEAIRAELDSGKWGRVRASLTFRRVFVVLADPASVFRTP